MPTHRFPAHQFDAYYSTVFEVSADDVWERIRDFNDDRWSGSVTTSGSDNQRTGSDVATVRVHTVVRDQGEAEHREDLRAYSDIDRSVTYGFFDEPPIAISDYRTTLRVIPVTDGDRALVEWKATFDCPADQRDHWRHWMTTNYAKWLNALRAELASA